MYRNCVLKMSNSNIKDDPILEEKDDKSDASSDVSNDEDDDMDSMIDNEENPDEDGDLDDDNEDMDGDGDDMDGQMDMDDEDLEDLEEIQDDGNETEDELLNELENEDEDVSYQKLEDYVVSSDLERMHPEINSINFEEIAALTKVVRDKHGRIIDPLHTTAPFMTKYEKARIIGTRAEQLERGAVPMIEIEPHMINGRTIALMEFEQKKIPFIIARPLPNKAIEYWRVEDLECL